MLKNRRLLISVLVLILSLYLGHGIVTGSISIPGEQASNQPSAINGSLLDDIIKAGIGLTILIAYWYVLSVFIKNNLIKVVVLIATIPFLLCAAWLSAWSGYGN